MSSSWYISSFGTHSLFETNSSVSTFRLFETCLFLIRVLGYISLFETFFLLTQVRRYISSFRNVSLLCCEFVGTLGLLETLIRVRWYVEFSLLKISVGFVGKNEASKLDFASRDPGGISPRRGPSREDIALMGSGSSNDLLRLEQFTLMGFRPCGRYPGRISSVAMLRVSTPP